MAVIQFDKVLETDLNPEQRRAVESIHGPVLVLAGAGSGKTRVIAYRAANLIFTKTCKPWQILGVTFTNKAAEEMRNRVHKLVGIEGHEVPLGTFHRTCSQILRKFGGEIGVPTEFQIFDDTESAILIKRCQKGLGIDPNHYDPRSIAGAISTAKSNLIDWKSYQEKAMDRWETIVGEVYEAYQKGLIQIKALDFDDLIMKAVELMQESPKTQDRLQNRYRYIQVDEYQDINKAQYVFTKLLAERDSNVCVVGDDDQSIYKFRGADPKYILNFEDDFPGAAVVKLEENYRSHSNILDAANALVKNNPKRHYKNLWTNRGEGEPLSFRYCHTDEDEAIFIAETIETHMKADKRSYNDFAILYRTNSLSRMFEEIFTQYSIPYQVIGGFRFYERKEIKDVIAYLKLVQNPWDTISLQRIINTPTRGIGQQSFTKLLQLLTEQDIGLHEIPFREDLWIQLGTYAANRIIRFCDMVRLLHEEKESFSVFELTGRILDESGYERRLKDSDTIEAESRLENIEELKGAITRFDEAYPTEGLPVFLEHVALIQDTDSMRNTDDCVKCLTAHSAKGLEFPVVFLAGMEEGLFPHARSMHDDRELEEERRLAYVGITRAMDRLFMSAVYKRSSMFWRNRNPVGGAIPSRFFSEIPGELIMPTDKISRRALEGEVEQEMRVPSKMRNLVDEQYSGMGEGWNVLPRAYEWAEEKRRDSMVNSGTRDKLLGRLREAKDTPKIPSTYTVGERVKHPTFGEGKVVKIQQAGGGDHFLQINFEETGQKLLSELKAPLERLTETE
ncbi:MAG TPA: UvrD-helicase domain-containing protein [bacterium]|jgi:DNA helicase-2/ATP-dependent DNA helicase PcrA